MKPDILQKVLNSPYTKKYNARCYPVITWKSNNTEISEFCVWDMKMGEMCVLKSEEFGPTPGMNFRNFCKIDESEYSSGQIIWTRDSDKPFSLCDLSLSKFECTRDFEKIFDNLTNPYDGHTYINHYNLFCESLGQLVLQGDVDEIRIFEIQETYGETLNIIRKDFLHNIDETEESDVNKYKIVVTEENGEVSKKWEPYDVDYLTMIQYV
jgi:hypothetical protein